MDAPAAAIGGIRPTFLTSRCTMWPGQRAVIFPGLRLLLPPGSMNLRLPSPSMLRWLVTVRRLIVNPRSASSSVMRWADHLCSRRQVSIFSMTQAGVAFGLRWGLDERSRSPASPCRRHRLTHFDAQAREIPISAAT
ncbi:hypothetical protein BJF85_25075 [Saccharomonospora sp. CUA-673]|nr:hypothetical protein BJF85_25075 [Saccharomonospora sp. CUA-673]